jgi:hypothetical protein
MMLLLSQSMLTFYLLLGVVFSTPSGGMVNMRHPLHLSSVDLNYNTKGGTIEISCRLFTDDLENALSKAYKVPTDLSSPARHKAMDELLRKYMTLHLQLKVNGKSLNLNYLGFEKDKEAVLVFIESSPVKGLKKVEIKNSLLYDLFEDQTNIMHMHYNGKRKSYKLDYPNMNAEILADNL